jgi:TolB protein
VASMASPGKAWLLALCALLAAGAAMAAREPVLKQIDLPHSYYWRELYLPQLTSGPSSLAFMPDGEELIYSMAGSLWRQRIGSDKAIELTAAPRAYDYQPDVARDGRSVVFARYDGNAIELWRLDLASGREQPLTSTAAVNVEPRLSPDGHQLAWVSSEGSGHFNLFVADIDASGLRNAHPLLGESRSTIDRYYYSAVDHAINPSWSPDGQSIVFVGNHEIAWGTGDLNVVRLDDTGHPRRILSEETSWNARPELAPDGKRLLYASYHGRQWQQPWLTTIDGAAPLPLAFGEFDRRNARWSPDGQRIAVIGNQSGNTDLQVIDVVGGASFALVASERRYKTPRATLLIDIAGANGQAMPARVSVLGSDGRAYAPADAWMHADDGFDRKRQSSETHYFHCAPPCRLDVPVGDVRVTVQHGFANLPWQGKILAVAGKENHLQARLVANALPAAFGDWLSADLHIHMNYGGSYRNTPANLVRQAQAEDLDVAFNLIVNKEERIPDIAYFRSDTDPASTTRTTLLQAQEYHSSFWGHLGLLQLDDHYLTPDFTSYRHTALGSAWPHNGVIADLAHAQHALVGYVHPFDTVPDPVKDLALSHELPADVIHGKVDYLEVVGFSDHKATAAVWYRLLNLGFHLAAGSGTDAMANYASLRGPVGLNRVFLDSAGLRDRDAIANALKGGHGFVSNGPLTGLLLDGAKPGDSVQQKPTYRYRVALRSPVAIDHLELVHNGQVVKIFALRGDRRTYDGEGEIALADGGWLLLRAWNDEADPLLLDLYPYATTNPVWLGEKVMAATAAADATWFAAWLDRVLAVVAARDDFNTKEEKQSTLTYLHQARDAYLDLAKHPTPGISP